MDVMIVDGGARGHALAWRIAQSPECNRLWIAPGTAGAAEIAEIARESDGEPIATTNIASLRRFAMEQSVDLTLPLADEPLALGIVDAFAEDNLPIFGPTRAAAKIESSKLLMKQVAEQKSVPTAKYEVFGNPSEVINYLQTQTFPVLLKADGLAQGKGVKVGHDLNEAKRALTELRESGHFAGRHDKQILVEEYLEGPEISLHAWCDGETYAMFPFAMQDHKTIYDNDEGPMTGGMGVIAPVPGLTPKDINQLGRQFVEPFMRHARDKGHPFKGIMYPGLKLTKDGPKLLEINVRPGDPETEVWAPLLQTDPIAIIMACAEGRLAELPPIKWHNAAAACIVLAAKGYPLDVKKGEIIEGLDRLDGMEGLLVFHGGTARNDQNQLVASGGRVISLVAVGKPGEQLPDVIKRGYVASKKIRFGDERPQIRHDIGNSALSQVLKQRVEIMRRSLTT